MFQSPTQLFLRVPRDISDALVNKSSWFPMVTVILFCFFFCITLGMSVPQVSLPAGFCSYWWCRSCPTSYSESGVDAATVGSEVLLAPALTEVGDRRARTVTAILSWGWLPLTSCSSPALLQSRRNCHPPLCPSFCGSLVPRVVQLHALNLPRRLFLYTSPLWVLFIVVLALMRG